MKIKRSVYDRIVAQAREGLPNEICGYLAGVDSTVSVHYELTNIDKSPDHYTMDPKEQFGAYKDAREKGLKLVACYHSHPETPARPSREDIRLAYDSSMLYVIISMMAPASPDVRAFQIDQKSDSVRNEPVEIVD